MPGSSGGESVAAANPSAVLPFHLASLFRQDRIWPIERNTYADSGVQSRTLASTSRKAWSIEFPLTAAQREALKEFFLEHGAGAFVFYDTYETVPKFSYDETGLAVTGRYTVRFDGPWQSVLQMGQLCALVSLRLIEVS